MDYVRFHDVISLTEASSQDRPDKKPFWKYLGNPKKVRGSEGVLFPYGWRNGDQSLGSTHALKPQDSFKYFS